MAEFTILQRKPVTIDFLQLDHIQVFTHTIFANVSAANFRNSSFTVQAKDSGKVKGLTAAV